jgi:hypothetical protein
MCHKAMFQRMSHNLLAIYSWHNSLTLSHTKGSPHPLAHVGCVRPGQLLWLLVGRTGHCSCSDNAGCVLGSSSVTPLVTDRADKALKHPATTAAANYVCVISHLDHALQLLVLPLAKVCTRHVNHSCFSFWL